MTTIQERTTELFESLKKNHLSLPELASHCRNLYGFWIEEESVSDKKLKPIVALLVKVGDLDSIAIKAKEDQTLLDVIDQKSTLEQEAEMTVFEAIAQLVKLLKPLTLPG